MTSEAGKLTKAQREVLFATCVDGCKKESWPGKYWRTFDQLFRRGLVEKRFPGVYHASFAGRAAVSSGGGE